MSNNKSINYQTAGVDINAGNKFVEMIKPLVKALGARVLIAILVLWGFI